MSNYRKLNEYYKEKFNGRTLKICIDGGFTCPNRDGKKGYGGCIFCGALGAGENTLKNKSIKDQVESMLSSKSNRANKFIVYFQNFTSTYKSIEELKTIYDSALIDERIVGLDIDTRPDEINEAVCKLLSSYKEKYYVVVELGLQTVNEKTHKDINQNITNDEFINAVNLLNKFGIDIIVHVMIGLPNETHSDVINLVKFLNKINYQGIKIHSTYVIKDTVLAKMYELGEYTPLEFEDYLNEVIYILTHINSEVVIHRITGDPPRDIFVAPSWALHKKWVLNGVDKYLSVNNLNQGIYYKKSID